MVYEASYTNAYEFEHKWQTKPTSINNAMLDLDCDFLRKLKLEFRRHQKRLKFENEFI